MNLKNIAAYRVLTTGLAILGLSTLAHAQAGNVTARYESNTLYIDGDQFNNSFRAVQNVAGTITVVGLNGTTVNGLPSVSFPGALGIVAADIKTGAGNDTMNLVRLRPESDLKVDAGDDNDVINLNGDFTGAIIEISAGSGDDRINGTSLTTVGDMILDGGDGLLTLNFNGANVGENLTIVSKDRNDSIRFTNANIGGNLWVETGMGADTITTSFLTIGGFVEIAADAGANRITLADTLVGDDIKISSGSDNDLVNLTRVQTLKALSVSTDAGNDRVNATGVQVATDAVFVGGAGADTLTGLSSIVAGIKREILEFESVLL